MPERRNFFGRRETRKYIYAPCSHDEHRMITERAAAENITVAEFMRRAINRYLFDEDEDAVLLKEQTPETQKVGGR